MFQNCNDLSIEVCPTCITNAKKCDCLSDGGCTGGFYLGQKFATDTSECAQQCKQDNKYESNCETDSTIK